MITEKDVIDVVRSHRKDWQPYVDMVDGDIAIVGGALRDWFLGREPKDLDFLVEDVSQLYHLRDRTKFGGVRMLKADFFQMANESSVAVSWENYPNTVFANIESGLVSLRDFRMYKSTFLDAMNTRVIHIINEKNASAKKAVGKCVALGEFFSLGEDVLDFVSKQDFSAEDAKEFYINAERGYGNEAMYDEFAKKLSQKLSLPVGVGVSENGDGPVLIVYSHDKTKIPEQYLGVRVICVKTGKPRPA